MYRYFFILIILFASSINSFSQLKMDVGLVHYKLKTEPPTDMFNEVTYNAQFSKEGNLFTISRSNGYVKLNYFLPANSTEERLSLINIVEKNYHLTDIPEDEKMDGNVFFDCSNFKKIKYRKRKKKEILGYTCFRADVVTHDGEEIILYLTKKIKPFQIRRDDSLTLKGFPLQAINEKRKMTITASYTLMSTYIAEETDLKNYTKIPYEEFIQLDFTK